MSKRRREPTEENPFVYVTACLNYLDPDQRKMIEHVWKRTNVSAYLTRLIERDLKGLTVTRLEPHSSGYEETPAEVELDKGLMLGLI